MAQKEESFVPTMGGPDSPDAIYDARELGAPKMVVFGFQHMFAMFGATILVPILTGLSVSATLLFAGLGTLLFHFLAKGRVPAFLGSSFAFIAGYAAIAPNGETELLPYACFGVACAGLLYLVLSACFKAFGTERVMRFFPPLVTGPIVIAIGLTLAPSAINNASGNWLIAVIAIAVIVICNIWGKGMIKIIPILMGVLVAYILAMLLIPICGTVVDIDGNAVYCMFGNPDLQLTSVSALEGISSAAWIGLPVAFDNTVFGLFTNGADTGLLITAVITIMPLAFATIIEHIGDMSAISSTCNRNFIANPGLHRTLLGDGLATILASLFGAPANTTYGENTGVLALTKVYDPRIVQLAACFAIAFSFCPKFAAVIGAMPSCVIGGVSLVLYGMISAVGVRNLVEAHVDFSHARNILVAALILVLSLGIATSTAGAISFVVGGITVSLSGLAIGSLAGIILNAILPIDGVKSVDPLNGPAKTVREQMEELGTPVSADDPETAYERAVEKQRPQDDK